MKIDIGETVRTSEGKDVGKVYRVIIDPSLNKVTHLVIETGLLFGRLIVIPMEAVKETNKHLLWLKLSEKELEEMPDFVFTEYAAPPEGWIPPFGYPPGSVLWPGGYVYMPLSVKEEERVPQGSLEINHGTEVFALDGKIGSIDEVIMDARSKRVTGFVVRKGQGLSRDVLIPVAWVSAAGDGRLSVGRTKAEIIDQAKEVA